MFFYKDLSPVFYLKSDGIYYSYDANKTPAKLVGDPGTATFTNLTVASNTQVTENGHYIFSLDSNGDLYKTKTTNGNSEKIAENVTSFAISPYGLNVVFLDANNKLFSSNGKTEKLISDDVGSTFTIGNSIFFSQGNEGNITIYKITSKGNQEAASNIWHFNPDYDRNAVWCVDNGNNSYLLLENAKTISLPANVANALAQWNKHILYTIEDETANPDGGSSGTLKMYKIANNKVSYVKDIATNVGVGGWLAASGNNIAFNTNGLMFYNGSSSVNLSAVDASFLTFDNSKLYYIDSTDNQNPVLKAYENGKTNEIGTNVDNLRMLDTNLYYLKNNQLFLLENNKPKLIDSDVNNFVMFTQEGV